MILARWLCFVLVLSFFLVTGGRTASAQHPMPPDVSTRVGRAQTFVYQWTAEEYATKLGTRDFIWNNRPGSPQGGTAKLWFPPGTFSDFYMTVTRVPSYPQIYGRVVTITACGVPSGGCPLSWFQAHHPEWIVLKRDRATPAYGFNNTEGIPLDIGNPQVQNWIENNWVLPALSAGYAGISIDNVTDRNDFGEAGVCSVAVMSGNCESSGGRWRQLYSGQLSGDRAFIEVRLAWLKELTRFAHAHNAATTANVTYDQSNPTDTARLIQAVDIWYDETGFNGDPATANCQIGGGQRYHIFGDYWVRKVAFITSLNGGRGWPMVQEAAMCPPETPNRRVVAYALASYYMTKNSHTYIAPYFTHPAAYSDLSANGPWPEFAYQHGAAIDQKPVAVGGIYRRAFERLLALINPSPTASASYSLPGRYRDFDGTQYAGRIIIPPLTALTLVPY